MPLLVWQGHAGVGTGSIDMISLFFRCLFNHEMVIHKYSIKMIGKTYSTTSPHTQFSQIYTPVSSL